MQLSDFGTKFTAKTGILELMENLGRAMAAGRAGICMLGGGNPAQVPAVNQVLRERMQQVLDTPGALEKMLGEYGPPQGDVAFIDALCKLLRNQFGWPITPANIALTNGSQNSFFSLFNMLAGPTQGRQRRIVLPLSPEYIGYADVGLTDDFFVSFRPRIDFVGPHRFKYYVDFERIRIDDSTAAVCVSRPTNPTGNVLTNEEVEKLAALTRTHGIPLIIDNAYGAPFPNIIFNEITPIWDDHIILSMSLSKLGLPGTRTGIIVANEAVVTALANINAVMCLATGNVGAGLVRGLVESGEILRLSREEIMPFYRQRAEQAAEWLHACMDPAIDYFVHECEGALFLWLWFRGMPITSTELYERLKKRGVLVVPGNYFFPGLQDEWRHRDECIRVNYALDPVEVKQGIAIIAETVAQAYRE